MKWKMATLRKEMKTDDARVFKTTSNAAAYRMELQKIELTIRRTILEKKKKLTKCS